MSKDKFTRINEQIRASEVRVVDQHSNQLGILPTRVALRKAEEAELDLVEVAPNANPPVCRIMDFGKYQYEKSKKEKEGKKRQHQVTVKEIRMRPKTDTHDMETKMKQARKFLEQRNKVKFTVIFRGRELAYKEMGREMLEHVIETLAEFGDVESPIKMEGRRMTMMLSGKGQ
ncbi:MAG: translation initiation factor IF-3 [Calditrichaeota bacterium]|nr:translation initiation factor IF-3 [Calditrichota bacterium]